MKDSWRRLPDTGVLTERGKCHPEYDASNTTTFVLGKLRAKNHVSSASPQLYDFM